MRAFVCLVAVLVASLFSSLAIAGPDLQVATPQYDFGEVLQGEKVHHSFEFTNQGDETLLIDKVRSSCGCTAALVSEKAIPPGGKGEVQATFDSTRFKNSVAKTIYLYSNDPVNPAMQLHLTGKVLETVVITPAQINFGTVSAGKPVKTTGSLLNQSDKSLTLGKPHSTAAELLAAIPEGALAAGAEVSFQITLTPKPGQARFSGYVLVPVDGVPSNELRIPVYASVKD